MPTGFACAECPTATIVEVPLNGHRVATARAAGIAIDALTAYPRWDGPPPDYEHAVFCLVGGQGS